MNAFNETRLIQLACDREYINTLLCKEVSLDTAMRGLRIQSTEVIRHKAGKRCLIKYGGIVSSGSQVDFLGKIRFKGLDTKSAAIQQCLRSSGFDGSKGFAVPRVYGVLPSLNMWLQEFVTPASALSVHAENFVAAQPRVARALAQLHQTKVANLGYHSIADESAMLRTRFLQLRQQHPELTSLVENLERTTDDVTNQLPSIPLQTTIHRDFYFDQILLSDSHMFLLDFDLCCLGPPELDVGNYIGHLREYAIRDRNLAQTCQAAVEAFSNVYFDHMPRASRNAAKRWTTLTLARHVSLSTVIPGRSHTTLTLSSKVISENQA